MIKNITLGDGTIIPVKAYYLIPIVNSKTLKVVTRLFIHKTYGGYWGISEDVLGSGLGSKPTRKEAKEEAEKLANMYYTTGKPDFELAITQLQKYNNRRA